jgi:hypothetical protein
MVDVDKLLELEANATSGKWRLLDGGKSLGTHESDICFVCDNPITGAPEYLVNMELIAQTRNSIRELCLEVKALREVAETAREFVDNCEPYMDAYGDFTKIEKAFETLDEARRG